MVKLCACIAFLVCMFELTSSSRFYSTAKKSALDLDTTLLRFTNLNTDYENCLYELWEAYTEGYLHPLVLELRGKNKFYEFDFLNESNLFINHTIDTLPESVFDEIKEEIPIIHTRDDLKKFKQNTVYILVRNYELESLCKSIVNFMSRVPYPYYDFVILNDKPFHPFFIEQVAGYVLNSNNPNIKKWARKLITMRFGLISVETWDPLEHVEGYTDIPLVLLEENWEKQETHGVLYGNSRSYRNMCRFQSMNFYNHPAMRSYKYTMRLEPGVEYACNFDPFGELKEGVKYAFAITLIEYLNTIPSLFDFYKSYKREKDYTENPLFKFISGDDGEYNLCHFWTNFEIISLDWVRSDAYNKFMTYFDETAGFYHERWGDAPLRTLAVIEMLDINEVQWMDIGYFHGPFASCPGSPEVRKNKQCICEPYDFETDIATKKSQEAEPQRYTIDMYEYSCLKKWWEFGEGKYFLR
ncbi:hypothetical protein QEN19_000607 [Hanseniaspora menglaensis]